MIRKNSKKVALQSKKRILIAFSFLSVLMVAILFRTAWIQVVNAEKYTDMAKSQQTSDVPIAPKRGNIYDRNGEVLASSATCYSVWLRPAQLRKSLTADKKTEAAKEIAVVLEADSADISKYFDSESVLIKIARYLEKEVSDKIRALEIPGIEIAEETKRFYPEGTLGSVALGSVTDSGNGRTGLELEYDQYLSGISGRWVKDTDINGNKLSFGINRYFKPNDGLNINITMDKMLQNYIERAVVNGQKNTESEAVAAIAMNPKTGEILAMASTPGFDPNDPTVPVDPEEKKKYETLSDEEQSKYLSRMWTSPLISDLYEPGSTFKLITSSTALETGFATPDTPYYCSGEFVVADRSIRDQDNKVHGAGTLTSAVGNSCNPFHAKIAIDMGKDIYYKYLEDYGMTHRTHVDFPGEAYPIYYDKDSAGIVELSNMGFGQGIAITPIQLMTAVSAIGNGGNILTPHFIKSMSDRDGNVVYEYKPKIENKVISEKTAEEMRTIMGLQVSTYGGMDARIPGYKIGGKTGTAQRVVDGVYTDKTNTSFIALAPIDDPKIVVLAICYAPNSNYSAFTAIPVVKEFLTNALPYIGIEPNDEEKDTEKSFFAYVPDITGQSYKKAIEILDEYKLKYEISPALSDEEKKSKDLDFTVVDQYPKPGKKINKDEIIYIYR